MAKARDPLGRLRKIIERWPETSEKLSHGAPTFWGGRKTFATFADDLHGDGRRAIWCKSTHDVVAGLVDAAPEVFFVPPYVGPSGWLGIRVDCDVDWELVAGLLEAGYRSVAPKRAIAKLDQG